MKVRGSNRLTFSDIFTSCKVHVRYVTKGIVLHCSDTCPCITTDEKRTEQNNK